MKFTSAIVSCCMLVLLSARSNATDDPWAALRFLEGSWEAHAAGAGGRIAATGSYTFSREFKGHVLVRRSEESDCKAAAKFDCDHRDILYVFQEREGEPLKGIYFDNEGHVIHYEVAVTDPDSVELVSPAGQGPQFRLVYQLKSGLMSGKFQMRAPAQSDWKSYLEWSGPRKNSH